MKLFKTKSKLKLIIKIISYILLIITLLVPISGYKMDLPGNIHSVSKEIKIDNKKSQEEFYSVYILSYNKPTLFQLLIGNLTNSIDVYKKRVTTTNKQDFFRGTLLEELSFQYSIINAYLKASEEDSNITIDYSLESYVITYSLNEDINVGERFTHLDNIHINDFSELELANYFQENEKITLTVLDLEKNTTKEVNIKKTAGLFGISYDKYFIINDTNPSYKTFYERDQKTGPSGGLLQTLEIYATLTEQKFNKKISGTGTISPTGLVGEIGGLKQKLYAANKKVDLFFVPESQYEEAKTIYDKIKKPTFKLVKVRSFYEALEELLS